MSSWLIVPARRVRKLLNRFPVLAPEVQEKARHCRAFFCAAAGPPLHSQFPARVRKLLRFALALDAPTGG